MRTRLCARRLGSAKPLNVEIDQNCSQQLLKLKLLLHHLLNTEVCSVCFMKKCNHCVTWGARLVHLEHTRRRSPILRGILTFVSLVKLEQAKPPVLHSAAKHAKQAGQRDPC